MKRTLLMTIVFCIMIPGGKFLIGGAAHASTVSGDRAETCSVESVEITE